MKKNIVLFLLLSSSILKSQAQDSINKQPNILIGVKGIYGQSGDPDLIPGYETVYNYGLQVIKHIHKKIFFETGIYSVQKTMGEESYYDYPRYQYLRIPLNARIQIKSFYVSSGFNADYYLRVIGNSGYLLFNKMQLAFNINVGLQKSICSKLNIFMEIGTSFGITPAFKGGSLFDQGGGGFANYGLALGLNYKIK